MLRSMADPFELNAAFLCDLIRKKAKEQSPQALLFCIRINHFSAAMPRAQRRAFPIVFTLQRRTLPRSLPRVPG